MLHTWLWPVPYFNNCPTFENFLPPPPTSLPHKHTHTREPLNTPTYPGPSPGDSQRRVAQGQAAQLPAHVPPNVVLAEHEVNEVHDCRGLGRARWGQGRGETCGGMIGFGC
jgi:hypothetical protein